MKLQYLVLEVFQGLTLKYQVKCFNSPLQPSEMMSLVRLVQAQTCEGVSERGLTLLGFIFLHKMVIQKYHYGVVWQVLRKYGYDNDMKLADEQIPHAAFKRTPEQVTFYLGML